jgi:hypothetical protein
MLRRAPIASNRLCESGCNIHDFSAVGKTREEGYDVCNPIMHVGARLGRIRDDPDNDENYCSPSQYLRYQSFSPPPSGEYLCLQMPSLAEVTGMASLRVPTWPGASIIGLLADRPGHCFCSQYRTSMVGRRKR